MSKAKKIKTEHVPRNYSKLEIESEKSLSNHVKDLIKKLFMGELIQGGKEIFYQKAWKILHSIHSIDSYKQLTIFYQILKHLSDNSYCICGNDAYTIFNNLFDGEINNFYHLKNYKKFWVFFHNLINLKLDKNVY